MLLNGLVKMMWAANFQKRSNIYRKKVVVNTLSDVLQGPEKEQQHFDSM